MIEDRICSILAMGSPEGLTGPDVEEEAVEDAALDAGAELLSAEAWLLITVLLLEALLLEAPPPEAPQPHKDTAKITANTGPDNLFLIIFSPPCSLICDSFLSLYPFHKSPVTH